MKQARLFKPVVLLILILSMALPAAASAEDVSLTVEATQGVAGGTITVKVNVDSGTPGWAGLAFTFTYDHSVFTLTSSTPAEDFGLYAVNTNTGTDGEILAVFANAENVEKDGTLLTMVFSVAEGAALDNYTTGLSSRQPDSLYISGTEFINANVVTDPGTMVVGEGMLGDVDGNMRVSSTDAIYILQHVAGLRVLTDAQLALANVNGDDKVSSTDAIFILQAVAGLRTIG